MIKALAQDPDELFDIVNLYGTPTGITKRRADVHRDGDWHRAIHVWIYGADSNGTFLLLQRRGLEKDSWPGALDATAAGHLAAGETPEDAFREIEEELGIQPDLGALQHVGTRIIAGEDPPHRLDREVEEIYLLRDERPLTAYRPEPAEVDALVRFELEEWLQLLFGDLPTATGTMLRAKGQNLEPLVVSRDQLIPVADRYFERVAIACHRALRGERFLVV